LCNNIFCISSVLSSQQQVACVSHTDIKPPDMSKYARWSQRNGLDAEDSRYMRLIFSRSITALGGMAFVTGVKCIGTSLLDMKNPSATAYAVSKTEVDIGKIVEGLLQLYCLLCKSFTYFLMYK